VVGVTHLTDSVATVDIDCGSSGDYVISGLEIEERTRSVIIEVQADDKIIAVTNHTNNLQFAYMTVRVQNLEP